MNEEVDSILSNSSKDLLAFTKANITGNHLSEYLTIILKQTVVNKGCCLRPNAIINYYKCSKFFVLPFPPKN